MDGDRRRGQWDKATVTPMTDGSRLERSVLDAYSPRQIAVLVEDVGVAKARLPAPQTVMLGLLAGAFIAFGAMFYTLVMTDGGLGLGPGRLLGGVAFSLGLILVIVAGAELFTGNNLIVMAWVDGKVTSAGLFAQLGLGLRRQLRRRAGQRRLGVRFRDAGPWRWRGG